MPDALTGSFFARDAPIVGRDLIGAELLIDGCGGRIVEVEAYTRDDPASHSFCGETARNRSMFGPAGLAYVYRSYGVHWMLNLVCGDEGDGQAVLVRALVPTSGREQIAARRRGRDERDWCRGPGRLGQALAVGPHLDRLPLGRPPFTLTAAPDAVPVIATTRIGIAKAIERPWRFLAADAGRWVSVPAASSAR